MLAGLDEVLTVTQDQQHPAAGYLAWTGGCRGRRQLPAGRSALVLC